ncbi:sensor histidine kinase, partial [Flavobacterium sp. LBUM151]
MKFLTPEEKLKERVKELTCLYKISKIISESNCIDKKVLKKIIVTTKKAWRFSDDAVVELQIQDRNFTTGEITPSNIYQISYITIEETSLSFIKVYYPEKKYTKNSFLEDEQKLLDIIAFEIGNYIT